MSNKENFERYMQDLENRAQLHVQRYKPKDDGVPWQFVDFDQFVREIDEDLKEQFPRGYRPTEGSDAEVYTALYGEAEPIPFEEDWKYWEELEKGNKPPGDSQ